MIKKLSKPPVYYTIVQAQFNPVAAMANYINEIQEKLRREGYTLFDMQKVTQIHFKTTQPSTPNKPEVVEIPIWSMTKSDRKSGFILNQSQLVYHTTHYETHDQFFEEFLLGLERVHSTIKLDHLSRLGLRYLNAVMPSPSETVDQYLVEGLHGVSIGATPRYSLHESVFNTIVEPTRTSGTLVNRVLCRSGALGYPPDINPPDLLPLPKFEKGDNNSHAVIDIDHFIEGQMPLDFDQTKIQLSSLHTWIKHAFKSTVTDYARKVWA